jgi:thiamine-phosphate pyrophosphorylase
MCLTADGLESSHLEQVEALCAAGADWIQLRAKELSDASLRPLACECLARCRERGVVFIINDRLDLALSLGADGVHLGKEDMPWELARERAGAGFIIGGTVNDLAAAERAVACGVLDYVGVGPFRFTKTKKKLAPVLQPAEWAAILACLGEMPSYAIGGIDLPDMARVRSLGVTGAAVCSVLYQAGALPELLERFNDAWNAASENLISQ